MSKRISKTNIINAMINAIKYGADFSLKDTKMSYIKVGDSFDITKKGRVIYNNRLGFNENARELAGATLANFLATMDYNSIKERANNELRRQLTNKDANELTKNIVARLMIYDKLVENKAEAEFNIELGQDDFLVRCLLRYSCSDKLHLVLEFNRYDAVDGLMKWDCEFYVFLKRTFEYYKANENEFYDELLRELKLKVFRGTMR